VIAIALVAVIVTTAYVRLTTRPEKPAPRQR
jgi:hypothetical protein